MDRKEIILFGAGSYGRLALEQYGEDKVAFFADNDLHKVGHEFCGKMVICFDELKQKAEDFQVVISCASYGPIANQFEECGIHDYLIFSPNQTALSKQISDCLKRSDIRDVVLYGIDKTTDQTLIDIRNAGVFEKKLHLADCDGSEHIGRKHHGYTVAPLDEVIGRADLFIISSKRHNTALQLELEQRTGGKTEIVNPFAAFQFYDPALLIYDKYADKDANRTEDQYNEFIENYSKSGIADDIDAYVRTAMKGVPLFNYVEVETLNRCNGVCEFCPVNRNVDPREEKRMSESLFESIIDQLAGMDYMGAFSLYSNNEPLLDPRIIEMSALARKKLPKARIHMYTNGTLLTLKKFKELIPHLDELVIDNYTADLSLMKTSLGIKEYIEQEQPELREKVTIVIRHPKEVLSTRGGDAPNRGKKMSMGDIKCPLPFQQLIIRPDGKLSLCCNDPLGKCTLGDLNQETILEAWHGEKYKAVREAISQGRKSFWHCEFCDYIRL